MEIEKGMRFEDLQYQTQEEQCPICQTWVLKTQMVQHGKTRICHWCKEDMN